jgi:hypothetical protein
MMITTTHPSKVSSHSDFLFCVGTGEGCCSETGVGAELALCVAAGTTTSRLDVLDEVIPSYSLLCPQA